MIDVKYKISTQHTSYPLPKVMKSLGQLAKNVRETLRKVRQEKTSLFHLKKVILLKPKTF